MEQIRRFFAPPVFDDDEKTRNAAILNLVLNFLTIVIILMIGMIFIVNLINGANPPNLFVGVIAVGIFVTLNFVLRLGFVRPVGVILSLAISGIITLSLARSTAVSLTETAAPTGYFVSIIIAGLFTGARGTIFVSIINLLLLASFNVLYDRGIYPVIPLPASQLITYGGTFASTSLLLILVSNSLRAALDRAVKTEQAQLKANQELSDIRRNLEIRVAERTRDLTLSAEVGRAVTQERNLDVLLPQAVEQIREAFDLYYVQIYLADPNGRVLRLRAGSGEVGRQLLNRGHRLLIDYSSINGSAAASQKPVLVEDTSQSKSFLPNVLLPHTRSELAVPLISGDRILGVLNMQSESPNTFTRDALPAYEILAGQLASAIENATYFAEVERARTQLETQSRLLTREGWDTYLDAFRQPEFLGKVYEEGKIQPLSEPVASDEGRDFMFPIHVAGTEIGSIQLEVEGSLSPEDQEVAARLATLAGQHLENLRLLSETERYRREAEQAARRLTREAWENYQRSVPDAVAGYTYTNNQVVPLTQADANPSTDIVHPLTLRGETIGNLALVFPEETPANDPETQELIQTIGDTLIAHIESLRLSQATETALAQSETLYTITAELNGAESLEDVLKAINSLRVGARSSMLRIEVDKDGYPESIISAASWPQDQSQGAIGAKYPLSAFPISSLWIKNPGKALLFGNIETDPRMDIYTKAINQQFGIKAGIYLPMRVGNTWVGLVTISFDTPQFFTEADEQLFDAVTAQAAVVVNNRLLLEQTTKRAEREALINSINQKIQSATTMDNALETAAREIGHLLKARRTVVEIGSIVQNGQD